MNHHVLKQLQEPGENNTVSTYNISDEFYYEFDDPLLKQSGVLTCTPSKIVLKFPEKQTSTQDNIDSHYVVLFVNNILIFSYQWLPIYTYQDFYRIKDMLQTTANEYYKLCNLNLPNNLPNHPWYYSNSITQLENNAFSVKLFENDYYTCIEIFFEKNNSNTFEHQKSVEIYIGDNLLFSEEIFAQLCISKHNLHILIYFLLRKLARY